MAANQARVHQHQPLHLLFFFLETLKSDEPLCPRQCNAAQLALLLSALSDRGIDPLTTWSPDGGGGGSRGGRRSLAAVLLRAVLASTVVPCLRSGGRRACQRCASQDKPHAAGISLERTLGVLHAHRLVVPDAPGGLGGAGGGAHGVAAAAAAWLQLARFSSASGGAAERAEKRCALCYARPAQRCGRCRDARFCGADCARAAWPSHPKICRKPAA